MAEKTKRVGIARKTRAQLEELQNTLEQCPHVEEVHFTAQGNHYFNVHELETLNSRGKVVKGSGKFYGSFKLEDFNYKTVGERKFYKKVRVHTPETEIAQVMTREEVLDYVFNGPEEVAKGAPAITSADNSGVVAELLRQVTELTARLNAKDEQEGKEPKKAAAKA